MVGERIPQVTQDSTSPGPNFKARLPHIETSVCRERNVSRKDLADSFPTTYRLVWEPYLVWSNRALKIGSRGVLSCVVYGSAVVW